jgi:hypothetical protein
MRRILTIIALTLSLALAAGPALAVGEFGPRPSDQADRSYTDRYTVSDEWNQDKAGPDLSGVKGPIPREEIESRPTNEWVPHRVGPQVR